MILTRTPLRISLVGGGTDLPGFYKKGFGAVVSMAIDKYIYVGVNRKFNKRVRVSYSKTENVQHPMEVKHDIIRESLLAMNVSGVEVVTLADIPGNGTGLGSSSALAVGLVRALYEYTKSSGINGPQGFAEFAYTVERSQCLHPVGKQDHFAASCGGFNYFQFNPDETTLVQPIDFTEAERQELESRFVLLWTSRTRSADDILKQQESNMNTDRWSLAQDMRDLAVALKNDLCARNFSNIGTLLDINWDIKLRMAQGISNEWFNMIYNRALAAGAQGGKLCGAGGGGFFLFWGPAGLAPKLAEATGLQHVPFKIDMQGSQVIYAG